MDDYTWQAHLRARKIRRRQDITLLLVLALLILGAVLGMVAWYFLSYRHSPEYAMQEIQEALEERNMAALHRYINFDLMASKAYDDLTRDLFAYDETLSQDTKIMFEKFYVAIKPQLAQGMKDDLEQRILTGEWPALEGASLLKGRQLGIDYDLLVDRTQMRNTTLLSLGEIRTGAGSAEADVLVRDELTQTEFALTLFLEQDQEGEWQVAYIKNYKEYLDTVWPLQNQELAQYIAETGHIVDDYNDLFAGYRSRFAAFTRTGSGSLSRWQLQDIQALVEQNLIPALEERQQELDAIAVPPGAKYLSDLRRDSTDATIAAWQHFLNGITANDHAELETAEALHKRAQVLELRISEIIQHAAVNQKLPTIP